MHIIAARMEERIQGELREVILFGKSRMEGAHIQPIRNDDEAIEDDA